METPKPEKKEQCLEDSLADEKQKELLLRSGQFLLLPGAPNIAARSLPRRGLFITFLRQPSLSQQQKSCWQKDLDLLEAHYQPTRLSAIRRFCVTRISLGRSLISFSISRTFRQMMDFGSRSKRAKD